MAQADAVNTSKLTVYIVVKPKKNPAAPILLIGPSGPGH